MKKIFTIFVLLSMTTTISFSQISDRVNDENTHYWGARPVAGNFGFFFAMSSSDLYDVVDTNWRASGIPLINMKYYWTDQLVFKAGVQIWKKRRSIDGKLNPVIAGIDPSTGLPIYLSSSIVEYKHVETDANWGFSIGAEKHFDISNIIDGYVGLSGNIGYERSVRTHNETLYDGDARWDEGSSFGITYGMDAVIGSNFFISDLPLALGVEFGFMAKNYGANKFKYEWEEVVGGVPNSGTYYTSLIDDFDGFNVPGVSMVDPNYMSNAQIQFTELKARRFDIMPIARVSFTYYLK